MNESNSSIRKRVLRQATIITVEVSVLWGSLLSQKLQCITRKTNTQTSLTIIWVTNCMGVAKKCNFNSHSKWFGDIFRLESNKSRASWLVVYMWYVCKMYEINNYLVCMLRSEGSEVDCYMWWTLLFVVHARSAERWQS